jgi:hypothetical protein
MCDRLITGSLLMYAEISCIRDRGGNFAKGYLE